MVESKGFLTSLLCSRGIDFHIMRRRTHSTNSTALSFAKETCDGRAPLQKSPVINNRARFGGNRALLNVMGRNFRFRKSRNILFGLRGALFCVCACVHIFMYEHIYLHVQNGCCDTQRVCVFVCVCVCVHVCVRVCTCVYMYSYMKNMYIVALHMQNSHKNLDKSGFEIATHTV